MAKGRHAEMKTTWSLGILALSLCLSCISVYAEGSPEKVVAAAAEKWLSQIDAGNYAGSWREASTYFQGAVTEKSWVDSLNGVRKPLGKLASRKLRNARYTKSLSGAPDGDYVVMQFDTTFANKKAAVETVTFMRDQNAKWKAAGYYIN
jgi:Protein of unknown function (DUF4019)